MLCLRIAEYGLIDLVPELSSSCFPAAAPLVAWAEMRLIMRHAIQLRRGGYSACPSSLALMSRVALLSCTLARLSLSLCRCRPGSMEWQRWRRILVRYSPSKCTSCPFYFCFYFWPTPPRGSDHG